MRSGEIVTPRYFTLYFSDMFKGVVQFVIVAKWVVLT